MTVPAMAVVDVYVLRPAGERLEVLALRRAPGQRCAGAWEAVHGRIEAGELPVAAATRELREETGLVPEKLYNASRVEMFYLHKTNQMVTAPVFAAYVAAGAEPVLGPEHDASAWWPVEGVLPFAWPRERRAVADIVQLVGRGDAGSVEDVLRVC